MTRPFLALVNRAAGGGRCGTLADSALAELRGRGVDLEVVSTERAGHAVELARKAYSDGYRHFIAVGGDGTSYEIVNGLYPQALHGERPALGFLPLGTGNSFLRDFTDQGVAHASAALVEGRRQPCDVLRLTHGDGDIFFINLLSIGFTADVATLTNRRFKPLGAYGYLLGVLACLLRLERRVFPLRIDESAQLDRRRCLFLSFNNSKFTGGKMMIAPQADATDGFVECVRWGPIGRIGLMRVLRRLYDGTHLEHPLATRCRARRIDFELDGPVDLMVDGEVLQLDCRRIDVLPQAMEIFA